MDKKALRIKLVEHLEAVQGIAERTATTSTRVFQRSPPPMPTKEHGHVGTPVEARWGYSELLIVALLIVSLFGVIAAFALFYFAFLNA